jgi:hypothetical protein
MSSLESSKVKNMVFFMSVQFSLPFPWPSKNPIIKRTESGLHASGNVQIHTEQSIGDVKIMVI